MKKPKTMQSEPKGKKARVVMRRGRLTLPKDLREAAGVPAEATFVIAPAGRGFFLLPEGAPTSLQETMREFRRQCEEAGVTFQDLLEGLEEVKPQVYQEFYGG